MDCGICIYAKYDDGPSVWSTTWRVARKPTRCVECRRPIVAGQRYEFVSGKWDGEWSTYKTCAECVEIRLAFACDGTWTYTTLWEDLEDGFQMLTTGCFEKLTTVAAKTLLREQWAAWKGLSSLKGGDEGGV